MKSYIIGYDLNKTGQNYADLKNAIKELGGNNWWHCLDSTWIINSDLSAVEIRDILLLCMDNNDYLFVGQLDNQAAWYLKNNCSDWLSKNLVFA
jgi:hypothetical protein